MKQRRFLNPVVKETFNAYPKIVRDKLLFLRKLIFQVAEENDEIGKIEETLKWGDPSYLTNAPKSGTTIRLSRVRAYDTKFAISIHCQTSLMSDFKELYPELEYGGNRSIIFDVSTEFSTEAVRHFIFLALTYHHRKKQGIGV
jgi:hypothetical protein